MHARAHETRGEAALGSFEYIEFVRNRAKAHTALGDWSPVEFGEANWSEDEDRPKAAQKVSIES